MIFIIIIMKAER